MTGIEALQALKNGKKVRGITWLKDSYIYYDKEHNLIKNGGDNTVFGFPTEYFLKDDREWEEYVVPRTKNLWIRIAEGKYRCPMCSSTTRFNYFYDSYEYCPHCANKNIITQ